MLSDGVVLLRPFAMADATALAEIWMDETIRARNTIPEPSESAARLWIADRHAAATADEAWEWAVIDAGTDRLAGRRALKHIDWRHGHAIAGGWIGSAFRGQRFAPRSLRLAAAHAFQRGLFRVEAQVEADNEASIRSVQFAGMQHEGRLRGYFAAKAGGHVDAEVFGLLASDPSPFWSR